MRKLISLAIAMIFITACGAGDRGYATTAAPPAVDVPAVDAPAPEPAAVAESWDGDMMNHESQRMYQSAGDWSPETATQRHMAILDRMVVRNAFISMETERFERAISEIEHIIMLYGGFIENSSHNVIRLQESEYWVADYRLRIPVDHFDQANRDIMALGTTTSFSTTSEDVTMQFADLGSRVRIREEEERRILDMIENTVNLDELIRLESRLSNVRLALDRYQRQMTEIDHLASFATIQLSLREVEDETLTIIQADSFLTRLGDAFNGSVSFSLAMLEIFVLLIAIAILPLSLAGAVIFAGFFAIRKVRNANSNLR